jgi:sigma-B regulation protein RsbU (phosphoserine phosphatase)
MAVGPETVGYFVADISGHGVSAAFFTSAVKALLRQHSSPMFSPEDTMRSIDSAMRHVLATEQFVTACYARLNHRTGRLSVVSAGHPPAIVTRASGVAELVEMVSEPLGVFHSVVLQRKDLRLGAGDRLFLYTDGLTELTPGTRRNVELLCQATIHHRALPLTEATDRIAAEINPTGAPARDDLLLLGVERRR